MVPIKKKKTSIKKKKYSHHIKLKKHYPLSNYSHHINLFVYTKRIQKVSYFLFFTIKNNPYLINLFLFLKKGNKIKIVN